MFANHFPALSPLLLPNSSNVVGSIKRTSERLLNKNIVEIDEFQGWFPIENSTKEKQKSERERFHNYISSFYLPCLNR